MNRVERLKDPFDDRACRQCGECCMVLTLESMSMEEAEKLGLEFCYPVKDRPGRWGIKRLYRDWQPEWAQQGVCVFLYPDDEHEGCFQCKARPSRPSMCRDFVCVSERWSDIVDNQVEEFRLEWDWPMLPLEERKTREKKYDEIHDEKQQQDRRRFMKDMRKQGCYREF